MKPYYEHNGITICHGDCREVLPSLPANSIESIVTDPPYELGFMGKKWDSTGIAFDVDVWRECLRVLKPGGHLLSFGGTRTHHRMVCAIEDAGFEIRDQIDWLYATGFPKSLDVSKAIDKMKGAVRTEGAREWTGGRRTGCIANSPKTNLGTQTLIKYDTPATPEAKQWDGWGTALKPAHEPICLARKPLSEPTIAENVLKWGTGAINIDGCRVGWKDERDRKNGWRASPSNDDENEYSSFKSGSFGKQNEQGRFPANVILDEEAGRMLDEQQDGASRFFYVAKASKKERGKGNDHPTVKPLQLMRYLVKLVTPPDGTVLDPFMGTGTTLEAARNLGRKAIGIEIEERYCEIAAKRLQQEVLLQ